MSRENLFCSCGGGENKGHSWNCPWGEGLKYGDAPAVPIQVEVEKGELIKCPFCGEDDFDKIGLKHHLINYCETYSNT